MIAAASIKEGETLPQFVRDLLSAPPRRGGGLHNWLFRAARVLHPFRSREEIIDLLRSATHGEPVKAVEIESAVDGSAGCAWSPGSAASSARRTPAWPALNEEMRAAIIADGPGLYDLWEMSPRLFDGDESHAEWIIDALFPGNPLLCCGQSNSSFATRTRSEWRGKLSALQLIVPSPMTSVHGTTKEGKKVSIPFRIRGHEGFWLLSRMPVYPMSRRRYWFISPSVRRLFWQSSVGSRACMVGSTAMRGRRSVCVDS